MARCIALLVLTASLFACGDDEGSIPDAKVSFDAEVALPADAAPPDATPQLSLSEMCKVDGGLYVTYFSDLLACYPEFEIWLGQPTPSAATLSEICLEMFGPFLADGSVELDDAALADCLTHIAALDCTTADFDAPNDCDAVVVGTIAAGDDCDDSMQCAGDSYCYWGGGGDCGVCTARVADAQACTDDDQCTNGLCAGLHDPPGACQSFGLAGDDCTGDNECAGHLVCDVFGTGKCELPAVWALGDACTTTESECGFPFSNLICDVPGLGGTNKCVAYLDLGDECNEPYQCDFKRYETCTSVAGTDRCVAPTIVGIGATCSWFSGEKCQNGLFCTNPIDTGGVCKQRPALGDSCLTMDDCGFLQSCVDDRCQYGAYSAMCPAP